LLRAMRGLLSFNLLVLVLLAVASQPLWAHAILMESTPQKNSSVKGPDVPITLRFNVRIDGSRSRFHLVAPDGSVRTLPPVKQSAPDTLQSQLTGLHSGAYKLQWQVLASDGHISRGEIPFTVN